MFRPRNAQKRVEIWESTVVADGFGGNKVTKSFCARRWAIMEDIKNNSYQSEAGVTDFTNTLKVTFRYDKELVINPRNHILKYNDKEYSILDVKTNGHRHVSQECIVKQIFGLD